VVVDDTAVTPQYLQGSAAERELPIIKKIAVGSLRNKLLFILPAAVLLGQFLPEALPVLLICGGTYLAFEGAEKVWERLHGGHHAEEEMAAQGEFTPEHEQRTIANAIRTDFILSTEIMVIALKEVVDSDPDAGFVTRAVVLAVVAVLITAVVYGVVALIVKMDDVGLSLAQRTSARAQRVGHALVAAMPRVLAAISLVGTLAMLWVGGHILLVSLDELGVHAPYDVVHHWEEAVHEAIHGPVGSTLAWLVNTAASAVVGLVVGAVVVAVMHLVPRRQKAH
jgi:predicted DNA repair protein MutK